MRRFIFASASLALASALIAGSPLRASAGVAVSNEGGVVVIVDGLPTPAPQRPGPRARRPAAAAAAALEAKAAPRSAQGSAYGAALVRYAYEFTGTPYLWGGNTPRGFDCSGYAQFVYAAYGIAIPRTADVQFLAGRPVSEPEPGDLLFFQTYAYGASHVAIYVGNGWFIQAIAPDVHLGSFNSPYFRSRYLGARRFLPD